MIYNSFYKHEARTENYDHSHCHASCDPKTEKQKYPTQAMVIAVIMS